MRTTENEGGLNEGLSFTSKQVAAMAPILEQLAGDFGVIDVALTQESPYGSFWIEAKRAHGTKRYRVA
jgi:hypothetical protein